MVVWMCSSRLWLHFPGIWALSLQDSRVECLEFHPSKCYLKSKKIKSKWELNRWEGKEIKLWAFIYVAGKAGWKEGTCMTAVCHPSASQQLNCQMMLLCPGTFWNPSRQASPAVSHTHFYIHMADSKDFYSLLGPAHCYFVYQWPHKGTRGNGI